MTQTLNTGITSTRPFHWVWRVNVDGRRVGTVYGAHQGVGFTARDSNFHLIGRGYASPEVAMQACVPMAATAG